jgi:hypothetical protein
VHGFWASPCGGAQAGECVACPAGKVVSFLGSGGRLRRRLGGGAQGGTPKHKVLGNVASVGSVVSETQHGSCVAKPVS